MKNICKYILLAGVLFITYSCCEDDLNPNSIFNTETVNRNEFDKWILDSLTKPYNISLDYYYKDKETNLSENVIPAKVSQSIALAKLMKHVWIDAYSEVAGKDFLKKNCFRSFFFVGSGEYTSQGTVKLGQAEGGIKVTLFRVNEFDPDNIYINNDDYYRSQNSTPIDMNYWYFHTMHHEFCHILTQQKEYSPDFKLLSAGNYSGPDWNNVSDQDAAKRGFVSGYATKEYNEDFAETYCVYITSSDKIWNQILDQATDYLVDNNNKPVYKLDSNGNPEIKTNSKGMPVYAIDENGCLIPETDQNGNVVYATDKNGNPIYILDNNSLPIVMYNEQLVDNGKYVGPYYFYNEKNDSIDTRFIFNNNLYPITSYADSFTPVVETINGDTVYNKDGETIAKYYRMPIFKYEYVQMTDESAKNKILEKLESVRTYFKEKWGINIDVLRNKIQEKTSSESLKSLNLKSLKD